MTLVVVNGARRELAAGATVEVAVRAAGATEDGRGVAVALDGQVIPRGEWGRTRLREGQQVEVVHAVQGG